MIAVVLAGFLGCQPGSPITPDSDDGVDTGGPGRPGYAGELPDGGGSGDGGGLDGGGLDGGEADGGMVDGGGDTGTPSDCAWWSPEGRFEAHPVIDGRVDVGSVSLALAANGNSESLHPHRVDANGDGYGELAFTGGSWTVDGGWLSALRVYSVNWSEATSLDMVGDWCSQLSPGATDPDITQAAALDLNQDGYDDLVIRDDAGDGPTGRLSFFLGPFGDGDLGYEPWARLDNPVGNLSFGGAVGDPSGDGVADVLAGWFNPDGRHRVIVLDGTRLGTEDLADSPLYLEGGEGKSRGFAGTLLADVTGDGIDDVHVVSASPDWGGGWPIYEGPIEGFRDWNDYTVYIAEDDWFEYMGTSWGNETSLDLDGDGYGDLVLGAFNAGPDITDYGRVFIFHGPLTETGYASDLASARITGDQPDWDSDFGRTLTHTPDLDGDGFPDLVVGSPYYRLDDAEGAAFVYYGPLSGELGVSDADATIVDPSIYASGGALAEEVRALGDLDGDGFDDIWIRPARDVDPSYIVFGASR